MQVFKCALRIIRGNLVFPLVYIVGLSFMGLFMAISFDFGDSTSDFQRPEYDFAVIDRDGSELSQAVTEVLAAQGEAVSVPDEKLAIQDAVAKGQTDYLLIIPPGYGEEFARAVRNGGDLPQMETVFSYYSMEGAFVDEVVNGYLGLVQTLSITDPTLSLGEAAREAQGFVAQKAQASVLDFATKVNEADRFVFYLQWSTYTLFAGIVVCVGLLTSIMGRADVRRRNLASPLTYASYNGQLILACLTVTFFSWMWTFGLGLGAFPDAVAHIAFEGIALCALSMLLFCLVACAFGFLLGALGANTMTCNAVGNIVGMVSSFLGGAWISLDLMSPQVAQLAQWFPSYWYSRACQLAAHVAPGSATGEIFQCLGVLLLFVLALFSVAALVGKLRTQTSEAGGNRAAEVTTV